MLPGNEDPAFCFAVNREVHVRELIGINAMNVKSNLGIVTSGDTYTVANFLNYSSEPIRTTTDFFILQPILFHVHGPYGPILYPNHVYGRQMADLEALNNDIS